VCNCLSIYCSLRVNVTEFCCRNICWPHITRSQRKHINIFLSSRIFISNYEYKMLIWYFSIIFHAYFFHLLHRSLLFVMRTPNKWFLLFRFSNVFPVVVRLHGIYRHRIVVASNMYTFLTTTVLHHCLFERGDNGYIIWMAGIW
jgi:hypothetical protein